MVTDAQKLQALLRQIRIESGLRQLDLAEKLGEHQSFVSKYESGERRLDILEIRRICEVMGVSLLEFSKRLDDSLKEE